MDPILASILTLVGVGVLFFLYVASTGGMSRLGLAWAAFGKTLRDESFAAKVKDLSDGSEEIFELVGAGDDDPDQNKILTSSPIGKGMLGKKVGEVAEIQVPMGKLRFEILEISFA